MQIQLKQVEIVEALKQYIANKGISLAGKTVGIEFTAGRKEAGLSAELSIEDAAIPTETQVSTTAKTVLSVVKTEEAVTDATLATGTVVISDTATAAQTPAPAGSLFN